MTEADAIALEQLAKEIEALQPIGTNWSTATTADLRAIAERIRDWLAS